MKNIKIYHKIHKSVLDCTCSALVLTAVFTTGVTVLHMATENSQNDSSYDSSFVSSYLEDYISKRDDLEKQKEALEKQIDVLLEKKKTLEKGSNKTFSMEDLVVIECTNVDNIPNLYIGREYGILVHEYHDNFIAHNSTKYPHYDDYYVSYDSIYPLFKYLTEDEIEMITSNDGKITTYELDEVLMRIRIVYQEQLSGENSSKLYTKQ